MSEDYDVDATMRLRDEEIARLKIKEEGFRNALLKIEDMHYTMQGEPDLAKKMYAVVQAALTYVGEPHTPPLDFDRMFPTPSKEEE